jgi:protein involved in sex pheromone biosynthesis
MKVISLIIMATVLVLAGCAPEVGSKKWCEQLENKPKGDWSANEAKDYAKHCIFRAEE